MYKTNAMSAIETTKEESASETIDEDSRRYDYHTGKLLDRTKYITGRKKELDQLDSSEVIRREATDGINVRMIIAHNEGDLVRWRPVSVVNQYERHDVFAGTPALKGFRMLIAKAASHSHTEHGHRKIVAIMELADAFFLADVEDVIYARPPAEAEPDRTVVWLLIKAHYGTMKVARLWQEGLRNEVFMKPGWEAVAVEPNVYHRAGSLGDDDDACVCVHEDDFMVESRIDVFQDVKAMSEHKGDINVISIIGLGQGTEAKIVKRVLTWSPAGFTWKANSKHARDLIAWAALEQSKAADKDNEKRTGCVALGARQSRIIGWRHSDLPRDG